ncbi:MAG TPA: DUF481 domain-containing protein [Sulfurovum sp.]|nr:DUF481 domain-containing protein [Sulfurovum sp.]
MKKIATSIIFIYLALSSTLVAENNAKDMKKYYVDYKTLNISDELAKSIDFGFSATSGTTNTLNVNGRFRTFFTFPGLNEQMFKILFDSKVFLTKNDNIKNNEEYRVDLNFEQDYNKDWLGYGSMSWFRNTFKNYGGIFSNNIGIGYKLISEETHSLTLKFGLGFNREQYTNDQKDKTYISLNQYIEYNNKITPTSHFYTKIAFIENIEDFSDDHEILSILGLDFIISENLSFSIEQEIYFDSLTSDGTDTVDTKTIAKIGYHF